MAGLGLILFHFNFDDFRLNLKEVGYILHPLLLHHFVISILFTVNLVELLVTQLIFLVKIIVMNQLGDPL
jgi:hypothetical protein